MPNDKSQEFDAHVSVYDDEEKDSGVKQASDENPRGPAPESQVGDAKTGEGSSEKDEERKEAPVGQVVGGEAGKVAEPEHSDRGQDPPHGHPVHAVHVDVYNRRGDADIIEGQFVDIVSGEYEGRSGAYLKTVEYDRETGFPCKILVRTQDDEYEQLIVRAENCVHKRTKRV